VKGSDFPLLLASEQFALLGLAAALAPPRVSARTAACRQDSAQQGVLPWGAEAMATGASLQDLTPSHSRCPPTLRSAQEILQHPPPNLPHPRSWQQEKRLLTGAHYGMGFKEN